MSKIEVVRREKRLCTCCMEEHDVEIVCVKEHTDFKDALIEYDALYFYCSFADELYMDETMANQNDVMMKDAYRRNVGLLTSEEIRTLRGNYGISQRDLCILLGWGGKTITRYESHQIQDRAHDAILRKLKNDPEWFLYLLSEAKENLPDLAYRKYFENATNLYESNQDSYLRKVIKAKYAKFEENQIIHGKVKLSLDKVVDVIRYFASDVQVTNLYKVKMMTLLWYADALSYEKRGYAITGLVYQALPIGVFPLGHEYIAGLTGVPCKEENIGDGTAYYFSLKGDTEYPSLTNADKEILDIVSKQLGKMTKNEIVAFLYNEQADVQKNQTGSVETKKNPLLFFDFVLG